MVLDYFIASAGFICRASMLGQGVVCAITTCYRTRQYSRNGHGHWTQPSYELAGCMILDIDGHGTLKTQLYRECNASSLCPIYFKRWWTAWRRRNAQTLCRLCNANNLFNVVISLDVYCSLIWSILPYNDLCLLSTWTHRLKKLIVYSHKFHGTKFPS